MLSINKRLMSTWIKERLAQTHKLNPNKVVGIVVDKSEI